MDIEDLYKEFQQTKGSDKLALIHIILRRIHEMVELEKPQKQEKKLPSRTVGIKIKEEPIDLDIVPSDEFLREDFLPLISPNTLFCLPIRYKGF